MNPPRPSQPHAKKSPPAQRGYKPIKIIQVKGLARRHQNPETEPHPENVVFAIENASF